MVRERQSGRSLAFLGACGPAPRRTQARRATARVSFLIHGPHATRLMSTPSLRAGAWCTYFNPRSTRMLGGHGVEPGAPLLERVAPLRLPLLAPRLLLPRVERRRGDLLVLLRRRRRTLLPLAVVPVGRGEEGGGGAVRGGRWDKRRSARERADEQRCHHPLRRPSADFPKRRQCGCS